MKLLRLELRHWCQHTELDLLFPDEPILLLSGPNNSGKSNIVRAIGRVLALGRSEFGDASAIQHGAEQASVRLTALTHERMPFTISRDLKPRLTRARLEFADQVLTNADEIQHQLQEWFGRQETLLELFIAPQGQIASLIKERGKDRLTNFIEICGFKRFLQKQVLLNKFVKKFPTLSDPHSVLQDVTSKQETLDKQRNERKAFLQALPPQEELQREFNSLQQSRTLHQDTEKELSARRKTLAEIQQDVGQPLPDLQQIQMRLQTARELLAHSQLAARHQQLGEVRHALGLVQGELMTVPQDLTDYAQQLQQHGESLQTKITERNELAQARNILAQRRADLQKLEHTLAEEQTFLAGLSHSRNWYQLTLEQISQLHTASHQLAAAEQSLKQKKEALLRHQAVTPLSSEALKACQASEAKLWEIRNLHEHAKAAGDQCPLCLQAWNPTALAQRRTQLEELACELQTDLKLSPEAIAAYQRWTKAQAEIAKLGPEIQYEAAACNEQQQQLLKHMEELQIPSQELPAIPRIMTIYHRVQAALAPPLADVRSLREQIANEAPVEQARAARESQLTTEIEQGSSQIRKLLQKQTVAHENAKKQAQLKQQADMLQVQVTQLETGLSPKPEAYERQTDYAEVSAQTEKNIDELQTTFQKASGDWTRRFEQLRSVELLKSEVTSAESKLRTLRWEPGHEIRLHELETRLGQIRQVQTELDLLKKQSDQLEQQHAELQVDKQRFEQQTKDIDDLEAVSAFLSYDNGPLKFLTGFFEDALHQTNLLLTEMEVPIRLQLGKDLDILVEEKDARSTSALALGGGYSNLAGIAFRIALQRMILPRVHVLILDEPSTHIDESNMDLLMPFFERLKENIGRYGIEQCIVIDHHPAWRNTTAAIMELQPKEAPRKYSF
jgi:exonuclease SbcC